MFAELHIIQNFAPSCLNRDDTNSPKDCMFGGVRRARISSQCVKRAIRSYANAVESLNDSAAVRTKRLLARLVESLVAAGKPEEEARITAEAAINACGLNLAGDGEKTQYLLYLGKSEIAAMGKLVLHHWDALKSAAKPEEEKTGKKKKKSEGLPAEVCKAFKAVLDGGKAVDLALFGRMLADLPDKNINAACQVAHAISTHKTDFEMDFYTAVDDLKPEDSSGADMMGTVEFNSACFYRYAVIDWNRLVENLGGDVELARVGVEAFINAAVSAIPTGKQNTFAAQNPPSFVLATVRDNGQPWSLANAFEKPVKTTGGSGVVDTSIEQLDTYWGRLQRMYGGTPKSLSWVSLDRTDELPALGKPVQNVRNLVAGVLQALPKEAS